MFNDKTRRWLVNKTNPEYIDYISRLASVTAPLAQVLINRGMKTPDQLDAFLNPDLGKLSDPFELPDLRKAIDRIGEAKRRGQLVLIHGDYDADGVTATAIMVEGLRKFGLDVHYFIPNRMLHGYGFGEAGIERAKGIGANLIITVDCGISSFDAVSTARSLGIEVIITDHHEPIEEIGSKGQHAREDLSDHNGSGVRRPRFQLPEAFAVVNPKLTTNHPASRTLSGAGVAFKVIQALFNNNIDVIHPLLDLAAIGTAADVVPVIGENRIILKKALTLIEAGERKGIRALKEASGVRPGPIRTSHLYFSLIPRINAAGRIDDANNVVRLLTTESDAEAEDLSKWLTGLNKQRQELEESVHDEAMAMVSQTDDHLGAIVVASERWHPGVLGIVASRIAEAFYRPAFVFSIDSGVAKGSARSIPPFDIYAALVKCRDVLDRFGGHTQAAGLSLLSEDIGAFTQKISDIFLNDLSSDDLIPKLTIDAVVQFSEISTQLVDEITRLEPFGYGNDEPLFGSKELEVLRPRVVGNNHLKMHLRQRGYRLDSIGFDFGGRLSDIAKASHVDAAFLPAINEWDGGRYLQLYLKAIRPSVGA